LALCPTRPGQRTFTSKLSNMLGTPGPVDAQNAPTRSLEKRTERVFPQLPHAFSFFFPTVQGALLHRCRTQHARQGWIDKPAQHAAGPETMTMRHGEGCVGLITRDVNGAGARSAGNPHAACDAAETGNGITAVLYGHEGGNPGDGQGAAYGLPRQFPTLPGDARSLREYGCLLET